MDNKEKCVSEILISTIKGLKVMTDNTCDKYDIPQDEREDVRRRILKEFSVYSKLAINVVDTLKEANNDN